MTREDLVTENLGTIARSGTTRRSSNSFPTMTLRGRHER